VLQGNVDPPTNFSAWGELIGALGQHLVDKYGEDTAAEFFFEVWYIFSPSKKTATQQP
jgi:beta-xylosidase